MFHHKGQPTCLLCHCAVQPDEYVAAALHDTQQPLFSLYEQLFCQKTICYQCAFDELPKSHCIHRDCYQYYHRLLPESQRLRLRDLLELWPDDVEFLNRHNIEREKHAYEEYFPRSKSALFAHIANDSFGNLLRLVVERLPSELVLDIAGFSWPCALQKPAIILGEAQALLEFAKNQKSIHINLVKFAGEPALVRYSNFLGHRYATSVVFQENTVVDHRNFLSIAVTRDEVGVLDLNFQGRFRYSRAGLWYKLVQAKTNKLEICIVTKNIIVDVESADTSEPFWNPYWDCQLLSQPKVPAWYFHKTKPYLPPRMRYVELNDDTQGIIVGCGLEGFMNLETYGHSGKPHNYARTRGKTPERMTYICFPLSHGESLLLHGFVNTSFERTCTFGYYVPREHEHRHRYEPLVIQNAYRITGFCYSNKLSVSTLQTKIGVTHEEKPIGPLTNPPCQDEYTIPNHWIPQWYVSSACLSGVTHVRMFVNNKESHKPTMGMLLSYENHQESLGQYRFDCDVEDYDLTEPMYFFSGDTQIGPYIKVICNGEEKPDWTEIPRTAKLVWWFTAACSWLDVLPM
ncbi:hypothetical protein PSV09DRAFT_2381378 [Bipolaris maydis]|uniref:uncharacterized protein n=1 Tax=Cochliobolus heterostrophus TaxID=5016 RepID=UPI0024D3292F|nr:hypothetical protein J3E74DRAFT_474097 [Bipolaris maydis]KAJ6210231.1 hypothetical protein PSV09DRAFT_2381378 [Bipolaris maydis]KAJ6272231.1 hypothetical protein PSV08DRAFT_401014 [Bipolaris maydis]